LGELEEVRDLGHAMAGIHKHLSYGIFITIIITTTSSSSCCCCGCSAMGGAEVDPCLWMRPQEPVEGEGEQDQEGGEAEGQELYNCHLSLFCFFFFSSLLVFFLLEDKTITN
jgi:hypothetical protein